MRPGIFMVEKDFTFWPIFTYFPKNFWQGNDGITISINSGFQWKRNSINMSRVTEGRCDQFFFQYCALASLYVDCLHAGRPTASTAVCFLIHNNTPMIRHLLRCYDVKHMI